MTTNFVKIGKKIFFSAHTDDIRKVSLALKRAKIDHKTDHNHLLVREGTRAVKALNHLDSLDDFTVLADGTVLSNREGINNGS